MTTSEPCAWTWVDGYWFDARPEPGEDVEDLAQEMRLLGHVSFVGRSDDPPCGEPAGADVVNAERMV